MCYKPMSQDHRCNVENSLDVSRSAWNNEGKVFSFVAFHDFKQLFTLCFAEHSKECSIAKNEVRPADLTKSNNVFFLPPLPHTSQENTN